MPPSNVNVSYRVAVFYVSFSVHLTYAPEIVYSTSSMTNLLPLIVVAIFLPAPSTHSTVEPSVVYSLSMETYSSETVVPV